MGMCSACTSLGTLVNSCTRSTFAASLALSRAFARGSFKRVAAALCRPRRSRRRERLREADSNMCYRQRALPEASLAPSRAFAQGSFKHVAAERPASRVTRVMANAGASGQTARCYPSGSLLLLLRVWGYAHFQKWICILAWVFTFLKKVVEVARRRRARGALPLSVAQRHQARAARMRSAKCL